MTHTATTHPAVGIKALMSGCQIGGTTIFTGDGTPAATFLALRIGDLYVDHTGGALYIAGATGSGSWVAFAGTATMASGATIGGTYIFTKAGAADATAVRVGDLSIDYTNGALYMANATGAADWQRIGFTSTSAAPLALNSADAVGIGNWISSTATSGTTYGHYVRVDSNGVGQEAIAGRFKVLLKKAAIGNAHGAHCTLETDTSAGSVSGVGSGLRANLVVAGRIIPTGTYHGLVAEIYLPASGSLALCGQSSVLQICTTGGNATAEKTVPAMISFDTLSTGTGNLIVEATDASPDWTGSIKILVNGNLRYLHYTSAEAA